MIIVLQEYMVLDVSAMSVLSDEEDAMMEAAKYNVPNSRPCTATGEHTYNNNWVSNMEMLRTPPATSPPAVADLDQISAQLMSGDKDSNALRDRFLEQNHHYVNGYALRETLRNQAQAPSNVEAVPSGQMSQHNLTYVKSMSRPNAIMNKCYELDLGFRLRQMQSKLMPRSQLETPQVLPLCDMTLNKDYLWTWPSSATTSLWMHSKLSVHYLNSISSDQF